MRVGSILGLVVMLFGLGASASPEAVTAGRAGVNSLVNNQYDAAADSLQRATRLDPQNRLWWINLGWARTALNQADEALKAFAKAQKLTSPKEFTIMGWILWGAAAAYEKKGDCANMARRLTDWLSLLSAQPLSVRNAALMKKQAAIAREKIRTCPARMARRRR